MQFAKKYTNNAHRLGATYKAVARYGSQGARGRDRIEVSKTTLLKAKVDPKLTT